MTHVSEPMSQNRFQALFQGSSNSYKIKNRIDRVGMIMADPKFAKCAGRLQEFKYLTEQDIENGKVLKPGLLANQLVSAEWKRDNSSILPDSVQTASHIGRLVFDSTGADSFNTPVVQVSKNLTKVYTAVKDCLDHRNYNLQDAQIDRLLDASKFVMTKVDKPFGLCTWEELGTRINRSGVTGLLDDGCNMGDIYDRLSTRPIVEKILDNLSKGKNFSEYYTTCNHKVESSLETCHRWPSSRLRPQTSQTSPPPDPVPVCLHPPC